MTVAFAWVAALACATVSKTGRPVVGRTVRTHSPVSTPRRSNEDTTSGEPRCVVPPFLGVTPPTSLVPYASAWSGSRAGWLDPGRLRAARAPQTRLLRVKRPRLAGETLADDLRDAASHASQALREEREVCGAHLGVLVHKDRRRAVLTPAVGALRTRRAQGRSVAQGNLPLLVSTHSGCSTQPAQHPSAETHGAAGAVSRNAPLCCLGSHVRGDAGPGTRCLCDDASSTKGSPPRTGLFANSDLLRGPIRTSSDP